MRFLPESLEVLGSVSSLASDGADLDVAVVLRRGRELLAVGSVAAAAAFPRLGGILVGLGKTWTTERRAIKTYLTSKALVRHGVVRCRSRQRVEYAIRNMHRRRSRKTFTNKLYER